MGWLSSLFDPAERCERKGHRHRTETRRGFRRAKPSDYRVVAFAVKEEREICSRCGDVFSDWKETHREGLQGLSMPASHMDELDENGVYWQ